ncbi:MAG: thiolase family protein [Hyphomicrobiales bacterium]|nr:thiolase family protein [Hyphomicrobiales bacterium]
MDQNEPLIVGFAETPYAVTTGRSVFDLAGDVHAALLEQTGLDNRAIDGLVVCASTTEAGNPFWTAYVADALGLELDFSQGMDLGGASFVAGVARAALAVRAGQCRRVVVLAADAPSTLNRSDPRGYRPEWQDPVGLMGPPGAFGLLSSRYEAQYGPVQDALAKLAVTQRRHALLNGNACAKLRKPLTTEEYVAARQISTPINLLDCVMSCDGANAVLVTSRREAGTLADGAVRILGFGERTNQDIADPLPDVTRCGHAAAGARALRESGLRPADIAMLQPYDDFLIAILLQLEALGFCPAGGGRQFVLDTDISWRGRLPINTGGGQISAGQAGLAGGGLNFIEAVRQLRGEGGARQVADRRNAMVTGIGSIPYIRNWGVSAVMILGGPA